jgi:hypothetical protein
VNVGLPEGKTTQPEEERITIRKALRHRCSNIGDSSSIASTIFAKFRISKYLDADAAHATTGVERRLSLDVAGFVDMIHRHNGRKRM